MQELHDQLMQSCGNAQAELNKQAKSIGEAQLLNSACWGVIKWHQQYWGIPTVWGVTFLRWSFYMGNITGFIWFGRWGGGWWFLGFGFHDLRKCIAWVGNITTPVQIFLVLWKMMGGGLNNNCVLWFLEDDGTYCWAQFGEFGSCKRYVVFETW